jgi:hypothetical protein
MRLIIAALLGGIMMFAWGAVSHMFLGIGDAGVKPMPNEAEISTALQANITEPGLYFLPGMDMSHQATAEQQAAWAEKYKAGPNAIVVYHPTGAEPMSPKQFGAELASNIAAAFVVGLILMMAAVGFMRGVAISTLIGISGWLSINVSYWNWYRFPTSFVTADLIDQGIGWLLAGLVLAFVVRRRA